MRGEASFSTVQMVIHRPDWERTMTLDAWTLGRTKSFILVTEPAKDRGNGTLKRGPEMWMYNPKVNRVIKLPPSMMAQAWLGSDFSNNDLAKTDSVVDDYTHTIVERETKDGVDVAVVRCDPLPGAPVVWGKLVLTIRDGRILVREDFFDQDGELVKTMTTAEIDSSSGKAFPMVWRMRKADTEGEYTELRYEKLEWRDDLSERLFTLENLRKTVTPGSVGPFAREASRDRWHRSSDGVAQPVAERPTNSSHHVRHRVRLRGSHRDAVVPVRQLRDHDQRGGEEAVGPPPGPGPAVP
jgi:hypothetical protein